MNTGRLSSIGKHDLRDTGIVLTSKGSGSGPVANTFHIGITHNSFAGHSATWAPSKVLYDRGGFLEIEVGEAEAIPHALGAVKLSLEDGLKPILLIEPTEGLVLSKVVVATYAKGVKEIVKAVEEAHPSQVIYELINEPYFKGPHEKSNAKDYANLIKAAYEEVESLKLAKMPTLLVAGFLTYEEVNAEGVGTKAFSDYTVGRGWLKDIATQWPEGLVKINGFTSHPYGEPKVAATGEGNNNIRAGKLQHEQAVILGFSVAATNNWWFTEFGYYDKTQTATPYTGFGSVVSQAEQASKLKEALEEEQIFAEEGWLKGALYFSDHETEGWNIFGRTAQGTLTTFAGVHGV